MRGWPEWFPIYLDQMIDVIPPDAESDTIDKLLRGKVPGWKKPDGKWVGHTGKLANQVMTEAAARQAHRDGANGGMKAQFFPGLDIDTEQKAVVDAVINLAEWVLGKTSWRGRSNSHKTLGMYRGKGHKRRKMSFRPPGWKDGDKLHAIEWLAIGCYYNVFGMHPSHVPYEWTSPDPVDLGPEGLPEVDEATFELFWSMLRTLLERHGCVVGRERKAGSSGKRFKIGDPRLAAPDPELVLKVLAATPCSEDRLQDRNDAVMWLSGIKGALGRFHQVYLADVFEWWSAHPDAVDDEYFDKIWNSIEDSSLGWEWLDVASGAGIGAQTDFEEHPDGEGENMPPPLEDVAHKNALEHMLATTIYCRNIGRFGDTATGDLLDTKAFCVRHRGVEKVGKAGIKSTDNVFLNHPRARIVGAVTYRPGKGSICQEEVNGTRREAFNTWRGSSLKPVDGRMNDADVAPWLNHIDLLFGPPGTPAREHFLDWCAFNVQKPGIKINHAPFLVGNDGVGKDTAIEPLRRILGPHNFATIDADAIFEPFNSQYLPKQLLILNEAHSFRTREKMNKLKPLIAAPPNTLMVNRKNVPQYEVPNIINVILMSNHDDALAPTQHDRRYWVHRCPKEVPPTAYFKKFYAWLDDGGDAKVFGWLRARDISQFNHLSPAPMTAAKQEMIDQAQPAPLRWCREQLREDGRFDDRKLMTVREIVDAADRSRSTASRDVNEKWALAALKAEGFTSLEQVRDGKDRRRLWVRGPSELFAQLTPAELLRRYREEAGLGGWEEDAA
jgi:hypothetical protein